MDTNHEYVQAKAKLTNKFTHITHGNIEIDSYEIAQFNTGKGLWVKNRFPPPLFNNLS